MGHKSQSVVLHTRRSCSVQRAVGLKGGSKVLLFVSGTFCKVCFERFALMCRYWTFVVHKLSLLHPTLCLEIVHRQ